MDSNVDNEQIRCETMRTLMEGKDREKVVQHVLTACVYCLTNPKKKFGGREMLFPNSAPPWIKIPEETKSDEKVVKKSKRKTVEENTDSKEILEILEQSDYSDEKMLYEIKKYKKVGNPMAYKILRTIRRKQKAKQDEIDREKKAKRQEIASKENENEEEKEEDRSVETHKDDALHEEKTLAENTIEESADKKKSHNLKNEMPWCPKPVDILCQDANSSLDHEQQKRLVGMCQNLMNTGEFRHEGNKKEMKDLRNATENEYDTLVSAALEWATKQQIFPLDYIPDAARKIGLKMWKRRIDPNISFLFSNPLFEIDIDPKEEETISVRSENKAEIPKLIRVVQNGRQDFMKYPDIKKKCEIEAKYVSMETPARMPIEQDELARKCLFSCDSTTSIIMDATTACHLLTPNFESKYFSYTILVEISEAVVDGIPRKIIIFRKPSVINSVTNATLQRKSAKRAFRRKFIQKAPSNTMKWKDQLREKVAEKKQKDAVDDLPVIEDEEFNQPTTSSASDSTNDLLSSIFSDIEKTENVKQTPKLDNCHIIDSGYQYSLFKIGTVETIIRSRPPYKVESGQQNDVPKIITPSSVSFEARMEYLPNAGAMELSTGEWIWNYLKKLFKNSKSHILFRTHYKIDNLLQIDSFSMHEENKSAQPPGALPLLSTRTILIEDLLNRIHSLENGQYILYQEIDKPMKVIAVAGEKPKISSDTFTINAEKCINLGGSIDNNYFNGFSPNVLLQWQIIQARAPRTLLAQDSPIIKNLAVKMKSTRMETGRNDRKRKFEETGHRKGGTKHSRVDLDDPNLEIDFTNPDSSGKPNTNPRRQNQRGNKRGKGHRGRGSRRN